MASVNSGRSPTMAVVEGACLVPVPWAGGPPGASFGFT